MAGKRGQELLCRGLEQLRLSRGCADPADAEGTARQALGLLRSAMDWLEDTDTFGAAHDELDRAGEYVRRRFGCHFHWDGAQYWQACPVALAHTRVGISPAIMEEIIECSICGVDPDYCTHITGEVYGGRRCVHIIKKAEIVEMSFVARPANPDARILRTTISLAALRGKLGAMWEPGIKINCDSCLHPCLGVSDQFLGH